MKLRSASKVWRAVTVAAIVVLALFVAWISPAGASHPTIEDYRVHWADASYDWHWGSALDDHHADFELPSNAAWWLTWQAACCPDSPWHTHFDTSAPNHIDTVFFGLPWPYNILVPGAAATLYDGNGAFHMNSAQVLFNHDNFDSDASQSDDWIYRGSGTPLPLQLDAWSIASEEFGHVQNIDHFGSGTCRTMSGLIDWVETCKRGTVQAERAAAKEPYDLMHP